MRYLILALTCLLLGSCTKEVLDSPPLEYSVMPKYLDVDSIQPIIHDDTNSVLDSSYIDFQSLPLDSGVLITDSDTVYIPSGVLISDRKAVLYVFYRSAYNRQKTEYEYTKYLMKTYYDKAKAAELLYQQEILRLRKIAKRSWLEKNMGYIGFMAGVFTAVLTELAVAKIAD